MLGFYLVLFFKDDDFFKVVLVVCNEKEFIRLVV